jgi:hypothetical protein
VLAPLQARRSLRRVFASALVLGLLLPVAVAILPAQAATSTFSESFRNASLTGDPLNWTSSRGADTTGVPTGAVLAENKSAYACLTALASGQEIVVQGVSGLSPTAAPGSGRITGCAPGPGESDPVNGPSSGALRLTSALHGQSAVVLYNQPQKMSDGLDITFSFAMHSGRADGTAKGADGLSFFIKDGSNAADSAGASGGALGYALSRGAATASGVRGGLLGVGFDFWGNFSFNFSGGTSSIADACGASPFAITASGNQVQDRVVLRGPDTSGDRDGSCGYEYLGRNVPDVGIDFGRTVGGDLAPGDINGVPAASRGAGERRARVVIDKPGTGARVKVWVWPVGQPQPTDAVLDLPQPAALQGVNTFKFGFGASTGFATNVHEIWDLQIVLADPVIQAVQAEQAAAASRAASSVSPTLACSPDPVRPGAEVLCNISSGPAGVEILWRASIDGRVVDSRGVTLGADGGALFTFRAPSDAAGSLVDVELVDWGVATIVGVSGGPIPTRVDAGEGVRQWMTTDALLMLVAGSLALGFLGRRRWARSS